MIEINPPIRLLYVEDSPDDAELVVIALQQAGLRLTWKRVETETETRIAVSTQKWDVILSDFSLPGFGAVAALNIVRAADSDVPFIVVSGTVGEDFAVEMMRAQANDYVLKNNLVRLAPAVRREIREAENRMARRVAETEARQLALIVQSCEDSITSYSLNGQIISWNSGAERLFSWTAAEVIGRSISLTYPPDRVDQLQFISETINSGQAIEQFETVRARKGGALVDVSLTISAIRNESGNIVAASEIARDISERKKAEASLRRSEERLRKVAESDLMAIGFWTKNGGFTSVNKAFLELVGYTQDDLQAGLVRWDKLTPPEYRALDENALVEIAHAGRCGNYQKEFIRKDGSRIPIILGAASLEEHGDAEYGDGVAFFLNVTSLKQAEETLRQQNEGLLMMSHEREEVLSRLQLQIERMPIGYVVYDTDLCYSGWNPAAEKIFEYTQAEIIGLPLMVLVPPEDHFHVTSIADRLRTGDVSAHSVNQNVTKNGRRITCEWHNTPLRKADGSFLGVLSMVIDVTERVRVEDALRIRDRAIQAATQGILIADADAPDFPLIYVSPGFERMTGYTAQEVLGLNCRFLQGPNTNPDAVAKLRAAILSHRAWNTEILNYRKDGTTFWNELFLSPVVDATGHLTNYVGVQTDVTARRCLEQQLLQSQKMEAIGDLAGGIAHDFNNLLTIINGYCEILLDECIPAGPAREFVGKIEKAGSRAAGLTNKLLTFSRQEVYSPRILNLNEVVAETRQMLEPVVGEDIELSTMLSANLGMIMADRGQLEQVLLNLVVNARDSMPTGGRLTIETRNIEFDDVYIQRSAESRFGPHVVLTVTDTGCGMPPEVLERVFEPFFTTKDPGKGTGLGLATVYGIVKQSSGHLGVYSEIGLGTSFKIYLPRVDGEAVEVITPTRFEESPRGTEKVLLVEDEVEVLRLSSSLLTALGYSVLSAGSGAEALQIAAACAEPVQLLVTDVVMPGMGGRDVAERIRRLHPDVRVLFVSGYADDAVVRHGVLIKGMNFLQKPFSGISLAFKVREVLDSEHQVIQES